MALGDCERCGRAIDPTGPAVRVNDPAEPTWVPFAEDLRSSGTLLKHPLCFTADRGVEALIDVVHRHDAKLRAEVMGMLDKMDRLQEKVDRLKRARTG